MRCIYLLFFLCMMSCSENTGAENKAELLEQMTTDFEEETVPINDTIERGVTQNDCMPFPSEAFLRLQKEEKIYSDLFTNDNVFFGDEFYAYLILSADSLKEKQIVKTDTMWGVLEWIQDFRAGIRYKSLVYPESGTSKDLVTDCRDKEWFFYCVNTILGEDEAYEWSKDSTLYGPMDNGAGCYYEIKREVDNKLTLSWGCGC